MILILLCKNQSFTINNKLSFIDSFQLLSSSLESLVKNLSEVGFKCLSQEFDNNILDICKQKVVLKNFKKNYLPKKKFYSSLNYKKISEKEYEYVCNVWKKTMKDERNLYLKCEFYYQLMYLKNLVEIKGEKIMSKSLFERTRFKLECNA